MNTESLKQQIKRVADQVQEKTPGELPARGDIVTINGLAFRVLAVSTKKGTLYLEVWPDKDGEQ